VVIPLVVARNGVAIGVLGSSGRRAARSGALRVRPIAAAIGVRRLATTSGADPLTVLVMPISAAAARAAHMVAAALLAIVDNRAVGAVSRTVDTGARRGITPIAAATVSAARTEVDRNTTPPGAGTITVLDRMVLAARDVTSGRGVIIAVAVSVIIASATVVAVDTAITVSAVAVLSGTVGAAVMASITGTDAAVSPALIMRAAAGAPLIIVVKVTDSVLQFPG
jgi:hypothetical protein